MPYSALLKGWRILIAEDSYVTAEELTEALECEGADVIGPVSNVKDAQRLASGTAHFDAAILDVNLRDVMIWPVADVLVRRFVKLLFITGYNPAPIRERFTSSQVATKPISARAVVYLLLAL